MTRLVDIMASLELRFVQERAEDGQLSYRLDPYVIYCEIWLFNSDSNRPIDVFITYDGKRPTDIAVSRYAVRHLVSAEVRCHAALYFRCNPLSYFERSMLK
jgi:chromosome transmission fidelity protein 18